MLIRSQDKIQLVNIGMVGNIIADKNIVRAIFSNEKDDYVKLGKYSTEAKAIKVLDMIQNYYFQKKLNIRCEVFPMPQDSEVEA